MNGLQTLPQWKDYFNSPTGAILGAMNAVYPAGKIVALFLVAPLADRIGRKKTIAIGCILCVAFPFMQGLAQNTATFVASRAILGFCTSFMSLPSPILVSELAYPTHRGKVTALYNTSFVSTWPIGCSRLVSLTQLLLVVSRGHHCGLVYFRDFSAELNLGMEDSFNHTSGYAFPPMPGRLLSPRITKMARCPRATGRSACVFGEIPRGWQRALTTR